MATIRYKGSALHAPVQIFGEAEATNVVTDFNKTM